jgi:hypothetical protein
MRPLSFPHDEAVERLCRQVDAFAAAAASLDDLDLLDPSRCRGLSRLEVVVHVRLGIAEMAVGASRPADGPAEHDAASYWVTHPDDRDDDPVPHILWLRRTASAYARPSAAVTHLEDTVRGAVAAVRALSEGVVDFQGKTMTTGDFLATWVVELAVHELDLALAGEQAGLDWTRRTLEAIAGADLPPSLDDRIAVLLGLGRVPTLPVLDLPVAYPVSL